MTAPPRLRVAVLNRHFGARFGGAERYSVALVEQLAQRHEMHVFAQEIEHDWPGVQYHRVSRPFPKPRWVNQLWFAARTWWLTRHGFDVVHSHENTWHGQVQTVHVRPFRVGVFHGRGPWGKAVKWLNILTSLRLMSYWWLEGARLRSGPRRRVVASSETVKAEILAAYPHAAGMLCVIPPGVHVPAVSRDEAVRSARRLALKLPTGVPLALFVGNDYTKKGLPALLQALPALPALHLAVVGQGQQAAFRQRAQALGVQDRVHFLGSLPDMAPAYDAADLLVHPTTEDTYAMVVLEALAHGLPVVVSAQAYCGISADLTDGHNALLLENPRDAMQLAAAVQRVLSDPETARSLGQAGRQFAAERGWERRAEQQETLYREVTSGQPLP